MHRCRFRQVIVKVDSYVIAFGELQARTRNLPVKGVRVNCDIGQDIPTDYRSFQFIDFDAVLKVRYVDWILILAL